MKWLQQNIQLSGGPACVYVYFTRAADLLKAYAP